MNPPNNTIEIALYIAPVIILTSVYIRTLRAKIDLMHKMLRLARDITSNISEHDAQAIKSMKRRFNVAHDAAFGVGHPTRQIKARATATFDA